MRRAIAIAALAVAAACTPDGSRDPRATTESPPNVIVFFTDDQRADGTMEVMPHVTSWFQTHYPNAYATTPLCCPSRASLFTGRYAHNHGVFRNQDGGNLEQGSTMQHYLRDAGYATGIAGKFLNNWDVTRNPPNFDRWAIFTADFAARSYYDQTFNIDGELREIAQHSTDLVRDQAIRMLEDFERDDDKPWLLYVTPYSPHEPFTPLARHRGAPVPRFDAGPAFFEKDRVDKPLFVSNRKAHWREVRRIHDEQLRALMGVDELVADVTGELERLGETDTTLAFYLSDNGYVWGEHGLLEKNVPYLPALNVPLYVRWPAGTEAPAVDRSLVAVLDVAPTIADVGDLRLDMRYPFDGRSLLSETDRPRLLAEHWEDSLGRFPAWTASITRRDEYVEYFRSDDEVPELFAPDRAWFREYYDVTDDPHQLRNLLVVGGADDSRVARLARLLHQDRNCLGSGCP